MAGLDGLTEAGVGAELDGADPDRCRPGFSRAGQRPRLGALAANRAQQAAEPSVRAREVRASEDADQDASVLDQTEGDRVLLAAQEALRAVDRVERPVPLLGAVRRDASDVDPVECLIGTDAGTAYLAHVLDHLVASRLVAGFPQRRGILLPDHRVDSGMVQQRRADQRLGGEVGDRHGAAVLLLEGGGGDQALLDTLADGGGVADGGDGRAQLRGKIDFRHGSLSSACGGRRAARP